MVPITALASNKQKHQIPSLINFDEGPSEHSNIVTFQNPARVGCDQSETEIQEEVCQDKLVPSINPERSIVLYSGTTIDIETPFPCNVSPYMLTFGSESGSSSRQPIIFHQKHPFDSISGSHDIYLYMKFKKWLTDGLLRRHKNKRNNKDRYNKEKVFLPVPINFGVVNVLDKNWFYKLANEGQPITDSHIDVILYYIRKKAKYSENPTYRFSTVDCLFSALINNIWEAYVDPNRSVCSASSKAAIREYINGFRMHVAVPWHTVENIFIPVNLKEKIHWILLVVSFENRSIMIYDSIRSNVHDVYVVREVEKYAQVIPMYLVMSDFYRKKGLDIASHPKYKDHTEYSSFDIVYVNNIPQQVAGSLDSGVYLAAYAEYLSDGNGIPEAPFESKLMRTRYAALLWDYGMRKIQADAISDSEAPEKPIRKTENKGSIEIIEIQ